MRQCTLKPLEIFLSATLEQAKELPLLKRAIVRSHAHCKYIKGLSFLKLGGYLLFNVNLKNVYARHAHCKHTV